MIDRKNNIQAGRILFTWVFFCLSLTLPAQAVTVAVFPVEDLAKGYNSVNFELTEHLQQELSARNITVVDPEAVIGFMSRNKIRWLGYLDTTHILAAQKELQADLILLGTVSQRQETRSPTFGLTLNLVRTADAGSAWSATGGLSLMDMQTLLGINEPTSLAELWPVLAGSLIARMPDDHNELLLPPSLSNEEKNESIVKLSVSHVSLEPKFVRPGQEVKCAVEFKHLGDEEHYPQVFVKVGTRIHLARKTEQGLFYEANWTGSEVEKNIFREVGHSELNFAEKDFGAQVYEGLWPSAVEDDQYPVTLILKYPTGAQETMFVGTYTVDSTPPDFDLRLIGREIDGLVTFRDKLLMLTQFKEREPISRWHIRIESDGGAVMLSYEDEGALPRQFHWRGQNQYGFPAQDGIYRVILEAWDRSGNMSKIDREVALRTAPPEITVEVAKNEERLTVKLLEAGGLPIDYWQMEVWTGDGELMKMADGSELPVEYDIPISKGSELSQLNGTIFMKDILGNKNSLAIQDIYMIAMHFFESEGEKSSETAEKKDKPVDDWASM